MAANETREALQLMLGPPIQIVASRKLAALRAGDEARRVAWEEAQAALQEALRLSLRAASL